MKPYPKGDHITLIRFNRYKVICNHNKFMIVDAKFLNGCTSRVDQSESISFTAYESELRKASVVLAHANNSSAVEIHLAVDEIIV